MEVSNKYILSGFLCLILLLGLALWEINHYMPIINQCSDEFEVINVCGCYPPSLGKILDDNYIPSLNITMVGLEDE